MHFSKRLLLMARKHWPALGAAILGLIGAALLNLVTPEIIRRFTAALSLPEGGLSPQLIAIFLVVLVAAYLLRAVCRFISMSISHLAAWRFVGELTLTVYDKLQTLSMRFFHDRQTGELMSRMVNDTRQIEVLVAHAVPDLVSNLLVIIGVAVMLFVIHPTLALITMIPVPFVVLLGTLFSKKVAPLFRINQEVLGELNGVLQDNLSGIQEIQSFCQERQEHEKMERRCKYYSKVNIRANFANAFFHPGVEFVTSLGTAIVIGFGGFLALDGRMNTADIVGFFMYLSLFYSPLATLSRMVEDVQMAYAGAVRVFDLLDSVPEIQDTPASQPVSRIQGAVEFRNVSFSYLPQEPILQDLSFSVQPGQMVAIVGPTGVGKTTVLSLLERFYDPQKGSILLDGKDIRSFTVQSLRNQISMVQQDVFLFHGTIGENIAYGTPGAAPEEIRQAAKIARADDFISQMPGGYDTQVGERGVRLSGGQKQRLAIARAVLRDTPILILDEATSAVDTETEREIQQAIDQLTGSRTIFVIAHRLSTVKKADQILVLAEGKLAEQGTHQQLLEKGGIYASLCGVQQLRDECFDPNKALV